MERRTFIGRIAGGLIAPLVARAQQPPMPVIGFLHVAFPDSQATHVAAFRQGLSQAGYVEGQNVTIEYRWAEGHRDRIPGLAADLVRRRVKVIAAPGDTGAAIAVKTATTTTPIVFAVPDDPVKFGLVASLAHPGGNATGINYFTAELVAKRLGLLRELLPGAAGVAVLVNPANATNYETTVRDVEAAARAIGLQIQIFNASTSREIDAAFANLVRKRPGALFVGPDAFFNSQRVQLVTLAARHAIPASYAVRDYADAGGLMSYGTSIADTFRQVGVYTGRILKGEKPADLPVMQPTKFELVINLKTAKTLGLTIPQSLLLRADEVIQ